MKTKIYPQVAIVLSLIAVTSMSAYAQRGGGFGGGRGGGFPSGLFGSSTSGVAFVLRDDVKNELNLKEDQVDELKELSGNGPSTRDVIRDLNIDFRAMRDMSPEERSELMAKVQKAMAKKNNAANEEVLEILTSKQKSRFKELRFQYDVSRGQAVTALVGAEIELDEDEEEKLKDVMSDVNDQLAARINELRMELYLEALGTVVSESKLQKMMGDAFTFESRSSRAEQRGGSARGRGQRGGGRGRGGDAGGDNPRRRRPSADDEGEEQENPRRRRG